MVHNVKTKATTAAVLHPFTKDSVLWVLITNTGAFHAPTFLNQPQPSHASALGIISPYFILFHSKEDGEPPVWGPLYNVYCGESL